MYFNKTGEQISLDEWLQLQHLPGYHTVKVSRLGQATVSTVWHGLSSDYTRPLWIFESRTWVDGRCLVHESHSTYSEAVAAHEALLGESLKAA